VQIGLRAEQTVAKGKQYLQSSSFSLNYTKIFPTTYVSYQINDNNTFGLSYGRRIDRPGYQDLNPFQYLLDKFTYRQGNPDLQPQFSHNIELSYNYKGQLNVSVNYSTTSGIINDVLHTYKTGDNYTTYQSKENLADSKNIGLSINWNYPVTKSWTTNLSTDIFNNKYSGFLLNNGLNQPINVSASSFSFNMSNQFKFKKGWSGEISGFYQGKNLVSSVIVAKPMGMFAFGAGKQVLKQKGTIRLNVRDPFWLQKFRGNAELDAFYTQIQTRWDNRRYIISFNWRFGKTLQQQGRKHNAGSQDEQNRVNTGGQQ
jgi:hypothetical protein